MANEWMGVVAPLSGLLGVVVGHWLNRGHSQKEKARDLRRTSYGVILSELSAAHSTLVHACEVKDEDAHRYHDSELRNQHDERIWTHHRAARTRFSDDFLILSDRFISRFEKIGRDISDKGDEDDPFHNIDLRREIIHAALDDLKRIARSEVTI